MRASVNTAQDIRHQFRDRIEAKLPIVTVIETGDERYASNGSVYYALPDEKAIIMTKDRSEVMLYCRQSVGEQRELAEW